MYFQKWLYPYISTPNLHICLKKLGDTKKRVFKKQGWLLCLSSELALHSHLRKVVTVPQCGNYAASSSHTTGCNLINMLNFHEIKQNIINTTSILQM